MRAFGPFLSFLFSLSLSDARPRFRLAEAACIKLAGNSGGRFVVEGCSAGGKVELVEVAGRRKGRRLRLLLGDAWGGGGDGSIVGSEMADADACLINLCIVGDCARRGAADLLGGIGKAGARVACYSHLCVENRDVGGQFKSSRLVHRGEVEALTSWSNDYGHAFQVYEVE